MDKEKKDFKVISLPNCTNNDNQMLTYTQYEIFEKSKHFKIRYILPLIVLTVNMGCHTTKIFCQKYKNKLMNFDHFPTRLVYETFVEM